MKKNRIIAACALGTAVVTTGALITTHAYAQQTVPAPSTQRHHAKNHERFPEIRQGMKLLNRAHVVLSKANHDFGGHRVNAMHLIEQAEDQLKQAIAYDRQHTPGRKP